MLVPTRRLLAAGLATATVALGPVALAPVAQAAPAPANVVTDCLGSGKVWLVVNDHTGKIMHNQCVEKGATGQSLLDAAGVKTTKDAKGFLCKMDSEPAACPAAFDGNFWQYYTAKQGGAWTFATKGADTAVPVAGTIEGWCYGKQCTPVMPSLTEDVTSTAASAAPAPAAEEKKSHTGLITSAVVVVLLAAAGVFMARRRKS